MKRNILTSGLVSATCTAAVVVLMGVSCKTQEKGNSGTPADSAATDVSGNPDNNKPGEPITGNPAKLASILPGKWKSHWIHIEMVTWRGVPTERLMEANEETWEESFGRKPLITEYRPDGTLQWYYEEKDSTVYGPITNWKISGDSLMHDDPKEPINDFNYKYLIHSDTLFELRTKIDWDMDGARDDLYYAKFRKLKN